LITNTIAITIKAPYHPKCINATKAATDHHSKGPKYGINSVKNTIKANENLFGRSIPNKDKIHRDKSIMAPTKKQRRS